VSIFLASLIVGSAFSSPLLAETPSGPDVAECVVDNDMNDVRALLRTVPGSQAEAKATKQVLVYYGGCNDNKVMAGGFAWRERAEIAEAAAASLLTRGQPDVAAAAGQADWAFALPKGVQPAGYDSSNVGMRMLGDCVLRANPQVTLALLRSNRGSAAETAAIAGLSGNFASCLTAGQTVKLKRQDLRLVVAEPLYHLLSR